MKIRTKFALTLLLPLVALGGLGGLTVVQSWQTSEQLAAIGRLTSLATHVSALLHETQKERGCTAGFLGSKGKKFGDRLAEQRSLTDTRVEELQAFLNGFDADGYGAGFAPSLREALHMLDGVQGKREAISALETSAPEAIGYYTQMNALFLNAIGKAASVTSDGPIAVRINAYNSFLQSKERAGIERAVLANTFARDQFGPGMYEKFTSLVALQDAYLAGFRNLASDVDRTFCDTQLDAPAVEQVLAFRKTAVEKQDTGGFGVDPTVWFDTITQKINLLKQVDDHLAAELLAVSERGRTQAQATLVTTASTIAAIVLATITLGWRTLSTTTRQLAGFAARIREIAEGDGDLTQRVEVTRDEIGEVAHWFNAFAEKIAVTVRSIVKTTGQLNDAAGELSTTASDLTENAQRSKQQANTIAAAAEEMSVTTSQTASATEQMSGGMGLAADAVTTIRDSISQIAKKSTHSTEVAKSATGYVEASNERITELGVAAEEIGNVINVIEDIAEQTNLLALNATIEAARAGEAGKGFAVVATEVKELAKQTSTATDGIRTRVLSMQDCTQGTVDAIGQIESVIREVYDISATIASSVDEQSEEVRQIAGTIDETAQASRSISGGVGESAAASGEITRSITMVDADLDKTAQGAATALETGDRVESLAHELHSLVGQFRV